MKFFIITVFCNLLSLGSLQETYKEDDYHLNPSEVGKGPGSEWPGQIYHHVQGNVIDQIERTSVQKPCNRRSNSRDDPISPPFPVKTEEPINTVIVASTPKPQPQPKASLRNNPNILRAADPSSKTNLPDDSIHKRRTKITISNPVIDSFEENHRQILAKGEDDDPLEPIPVPSLHPTPDSTPLPGPTRRNLSPNNKNYPPKIDNPVLHAPNTEHKNQEIPTSNSVPLTRTEYNPLITGDYNPPKADNSLPEPDAKSKPVVASTTANKCAHDKEVEDIGNTRRSMSNYNDGANYPNTEPHILEPNIDNENAMASVLNAERSSKPDEEVLQDKTNILRERPEPHIGRSKYSERRNENMEPTKGDGVVNMGQSSLMMMQTDRICYACSTANNPSCAAPDRQTTVKYCRKGNNACITKTFGKGSK
ncbi:hypothetical protein SFRURICE_014628 [Spodoptera frugiperda]|uniref:SFRICE_028793 n=1 Tax=Spodoptera frugiperda TaxID=7108 RepID=A0A2H1X1U4_SPOFR|nr:hypothetical protein SFRURICE_014628 [Spodoptera frugiperda]